MSELQFNITATDQASAVVSSVQKKVGDFGKDVGRSIAAAIGPMALLMMGFQKLTQYFEDMAQLRKDAFDWGTSLADNAAKMGVTVQEFQRIEDAAERTGKSVEDVGKAFKLARDLIESAKAGNADAAASLTALGINILDLENTKPEEVLAKLAAALSTTADPAERAAFAMAALGKNAKDLQDVLSKGFDIAGAFDEGRDDISDEDAALLKEQEKRKRIAEKKQKVAVAKQIATEEFLKTDPEGVRLMEEEIQRRPVVLAPWENHATEFSSRPEMQAAVARLQAQRKAAAAAGTGAPGAPSAPVAPGAAPSTPSAPVAPPPPEGSQAAPVPPSGEQGTSLKPLSPNATPDELKAAHPLLRAKWLKDRMAEGEEEKAKGPRQYKPTVNKDAGFLGSEEVERPEITVSSLRSIGGGMGGEITVAPEITEQLQHQRQMSKTLQNIERILDATTKDQTKYNTETGGPVSAGMLTANA